MGFLLLFPTCFALRPAGLPFLCSPQVFLFPGKFPGRTLVPGHNSSICCHWNSEGVTHSCAFPSASLQQAFVPLPNHPSAPQPWPVSTMGFSFSLSSFLSFYFKKKIIIVKLIYIREKKKCVKLKMEAPHSKGYQYQQDAYPSRYIFFCLLSPF